MLSITKKPKTIIAADQLTIALTPIAQKSPAITRIP
jgi:hypothetical protein